MRFKRLKKSPEAKAKRLNMRQQTQLITARQFYCTTGDILFYNVVVAGWKDALSSSW
jgi:hypothetical protein